MVELRLIQVSKDSGLMTIVLKLWDALSILDSSGAKGRSGICAPLQEGAKGAGLQTSVSSKSPQRSNCCSTKADGISSRFFPCCFCNTCFDKVWHVTLTVSANHLIWFQSPDPVMTKSIFFSRLIPKLNFCLTSPEYLITVLLRLNQKESFHSHFEHSNWY